MDKTLEISSVKAVQCEGHAMPSTPNKLHSPLVYSLAPSKLVPAGFLTNEEPVAGGVSKEK